MVQARHDSFCLTAAATILVADAQASGKNSQRCAKRGLSQEVYKADSILEAFRLLKRPYLHSAGLVER